MSQLNLLTGSVDLSDDEICRQHLEATKGIGSVTITSVSGGKTSSYMALKYPTDYFVFAVVLTTDPACKIKDLGLLRDIQNKCPEFEGSRELDQTLINILRLEQELGKGIRWVWGKDYDSLIGERRMLPNKQMRFCTEEMKLLPIYRWVSECFPDEIIEMNVGYRVDEPNRVYRMIGGSRENGRWDWSKLGACEKIPKSRKRQQWRFTQFPLYTAGIRHQEIKDFWNQKGWDFPTVSNCDFCFFHRPTEQRIQAQQYPERLQWWVEQEKRIGATWLNGMSIDGVIHGSETPLEHEFSCMCTD